MTEDVMCDAMDILSSYIQRVSVPCSMRSDAFFAFTGFDGHRKYAARCRDHHPAPGATARQVSLEEYLVAEVMES